MEDGQGVLVELVETQRLLNGVAAIVHEGLGLDQQDLVTADPPFGNEAAEFLCPGPEVVHLGQQIDRHHPDIVPVKRIFRAGISEADPDLQSPLPQAGGEEP